MGRCPWVAPTFVFEGAKMKKLIPVVMTVGLLFLSFSPAFAERKALLIGIAGYQALPSWSRQGISDPRESITEWKQ
jgi:hypothetical protein